MRIVIANTQEFNSTIGGVERISDAYARELQKLGHEVFFVAVLKSKYSKDYSPSAQQILLPDEMYDSLANIQAFSDFIREKQIELIHNQAGNIKNFTNLCHQVALQTNCVLVSAVHIDPLADLKQLQDFKISPLYPKESWKGVFRILRYAVIYPKIKRYTQDLYNYVVSHSDRTVLLSNSYKASLELLLNNKSDKLSAIPNWLPPLEEVQFVKRQKNLLYVGRLDFEQKRVDRLVAMWGKLYKKYPDWNLKIAGDGPIRAELERYVQKKKIARIEFLGFCSPKRLYQESEILCLTSTIEGLNMVLIEGMANGCVPIAYGSFSAIYDLIQSGENGFVVKPFSQRKYLKRLKRLMEDQDMREKMREKNIDILSGFDKDLIVEEWLQLYSTCIQEKK